MLLLTVLKIVGSIVAIGFGLIFILWLTSDDPKGNPATFEDAALEQTLISRSSGLTLASMKGSDSQVNTLLVLNYDDTNATVISLESLGAEIGVDPFTAVASLPRTVLNNINNQDPNAFSISLSELLPMAGSGNWHIATGTNFPEHAEETSSSSVFNFPKFGVATPSRTTVQERDGMLLDYEVEFCVRFDRPIKTIEDFDAAVKGFFLCGDFTDRTTLLELVDPDNLDSGTGFSDAKSGVNFYPSGPFMVIPSDWESFISNERMTTHVNGEPRQDARGGEMILDFRDLALKALSDMDDPRFLYQSDWTRLAPNKEISTDMTMMSGTAEGVIFTTPSRADMIEGLVWHVFSGRIFQGKTVISSVIEVFTENELKSGHFLKPGDQIHYRSSSMGDIKITVIEGAPK